MFTFSQFTFPLPFFTLSPSSQFTLSPLSFHTLSSLFPLCPKNQKIKKTKNLKNFLPHSPPKKEMSQICTDEYGQSFQLASEESTVLKGKECILTNIETVKNITNFIKSSLGPNGMDKILTDKDNNITVTNDGATILKEMDMSNNPISILVAQLSSAQDEEIGDGTTSVVILANAILRQAKKFINKGMHPIRIMEGFNCALKEATKHLNTISEEVTDIQSFMLKAAKTSLASKIANSEELATICVQAVLAVADLERKDVDLELIHIHSSSGKSIEDTRLIKGIVLEKEFSHPQMITRLSDEGDNKEKKESVGNNGNVNGKSMIGKSTTSSITSSATSSSASREVTNGKVAILSCPFEPPKLKNKNSLIIKTSGDYQALEKYEKRKFEEMIQKLKSVRADVVLCQWGFDDESNSLLMENNLPAVRWIGGNVLGLIASHIDGKIISRFEDLREEHLGTATVREETCGTDEEKILIIESERSKKIATIFIKGSSEYVIEETKRAVRDALCAVRNVLVSGKVVYGGGSSEISASIFLRKISKEQGFENGAIFEAYADGLLEIPWTLAENCDYDAMTHVERIIESQVVTGDFTLGVSGSENGEMSMRKAEVFESLNGKMNQLRMANDLAGTILKIDNVILQGE